MPFTIDMSEVPEMSTGSGPIPEGQYNLRIISATEKESKNGDPMVVVDYEVYDGEHCGRHVKFHYVVFFKNASSPLQRGAGISKHYLKCLGLPYENSVKVDASQWVGRIVKAKVVHEKSDAGTFAKVKFVDKYEVDFTVPQKEEEVGF